MASKTKETKPEPEGAPTPETKAPLPTPIQKRNGRPRRSKHRGK